MSYMLQFILLMLSDFSTLPTTGEGATGWITLLAVVLVVAGGFMLYRNMKDKK